MIACKKLMLIIIGISVTNAMIGMQGESKLTVPLMQNDVIKKELKKHAMNILEFARKDDHREYHISVVGRWLSDQRINISDDQEWNWLIKYLSNKTKKQDEMIEELRGKPCLWCPRTASTLAMDILKVVKVVASELKPGDDCSRLLVDRANKAVEDHKLILENGPC